MNKELFLPILVFVLMIPTVLNAQVQTGVFRTPEANTNYHHFTRSSDSGTAAVYINQISTGPILRLSSGVFTANQGVKLTVENNGSMGIGTSALSGYMLAVNGRIRAKEVKVETGWSDFVFKSNYVLPTLAEVEEYIKEKGHLKDIPSAEEVAENGIFLGEMDSKLLQKIEELTLYIIEQNKRIENLEKIIKQSGLDQ
ncbi:hypothetical protein J2X69_002412 [Algoriphagus sp. 4150]|uniref:hypothetical protein n=1 Tax=Algoriphagus sp. 4150 TaxID=2817756 RepID=UPI00285F9D74|nr:hypothetical protein [Algoriphagus sp. 4150]MDR7130065.1 hypothetical protein [Algoriphagus sp. 4150]